MLDNAKGLSEELLHEIFWSHHTTPHSTTKETSFTMVYEENTMMLVDIVTPSLRDSQFDKELNKEGFECTAYLVNKLREVSNI